MKQKRTIIYGPPGTGKTTKLLNILGKELKDYEPYEIAFCSFTKKGTAEGAGRAMKEFGLTNSDMEYFRTIHAICFKDLKYKRKDMLNFKDYKEFSKAMGMTFLGYYTEDLHHNDDFYLFMETMERSNSKMFNRLSIGMNQNKYAYIKHNYRRFKEFRNKKDFTDLLCEYQGPLEGVRVAIIDEAQDLNTLQWDVVEKMFKKCEKIYIAGDDDQAIYEWSGADVDRFMAQEGEKVYLRKSYRLPSEILDFSNSIIKQIHKRINKDYTPDKEGGRVIFYNDIKEVPIGKGRADWLLLARNNYHLMEYRKYLRDRGIVFYDKGEPSINVGELRKIERYKAKKELSTEDMVILKRDLKPHAVAGMLWQEAFDWPEDKIMYYDSIDNVQPSPIYVSTIHGAKGGEASDVCVMLDCTNAVYKAIDNKSLINSEIRCLYVACTRARKNLHIIMPKNEKNLKNLLSFL